MFGRRGEACAEYLSKGDLVFVNGSIRTRKYEKDGVERYSTEIIAQDVQFLRTKGRAAQGDDPRGARRQSEPDRSNSAPAKRDDFDDDIPF